MENIKRLIEIRQKATEAVSIDDIPVMLPERAEKF